MNDKEKKAIENLREYIADDIFYNKSEEIVSDFDKFCYDHCNDIDIVLALIDKEKINVKEILDYTYYEEDHKKIAILNENNLKKILGVNEVRFKERRKNEE